MEEDLISLCLGGIFPKLPFLLEDRDDKALKRYFADPSSDGSSEEQVPLRLSERIGILNKVLDKVKGDGMWWRTLKPKERAVLIVFLSENWDPSKPWGSRESGEVVGRICEEICKGGDLRPWFIQNFEASLTYQETDFCNILEISRVKLGKEWKYFPASVTGFGWIVKQIPHPHLNNSIDLVIPPALLFTDDYDEGNIRLGLETLSHIVQNVDRNSLKENNWALVIYDAVFRLSPKDPRTVELVGGILLKVLSIIEKDPAENSGEFTKYDQVVKQLIFQAEMSSDVKLKRVWLLALDDYLKVLGTATLHWSDKICGMLRDSAVSSDCALWEIILQVTSTVIRNTWPKPDCKALSEVVLRVIFNISCFDVKCDRKKVAENATNCFQLLSRCVGFEQISNQFKEIIDEGDANLLHPDFVLALREILSKSK